MKRIVFVTILIILAVSSTGCRRGLRGWGCRGARCAPVPTATPAPVYYAPQYAAPYCPPPTACPPASTSYSMPVYSDGGVGCDPSSTIYSGEVGMSTIPPAGEPQGFSNPANTNPTIPPAGASIQNGPMYGRVIGDRKLEPGEQLTTPVSLPVSSARKNVPETKE